MPVSDVEDDLFEQAKGLSGGNSFEDDLFDAANWLAGDIPTAAPDFEAMAAKIRAGRKKRFTSEMEALRAELEQTKQQLQERYC